MALFESYERRIDQINAALAKFDIKSIEEAKAICDEKGIDVYEIVNQLNQSVLKMLVGHTLSVLQWQSKMEMLKL